MYWLIGIILLITLIIGIILISRVRITVKYVHQAGNDICTLRARFLRGLLDFTWEFPLNEMEHDEDGKLHMTYETETEVGSNKKKDEKDITFKAESLVNRANQAKGLLDSVYQLGSIVRKFMKSVTVEEFQWVSTIGTGDAASTGVFSGMLWTIKGSVTGLLSSATNLFKPPVLEVMPSFQVPVVQTNLLCMFSFRIGKAMLAAYLIVKNWKGRNRHVRTSNSGLDANSDGKY